MNDWYRLEASEAAERLQVSPAAGLSAKEAAQRLTKYGPNELLEQGGKGLVRILWEQLAATMVVVLIVAAMVSALLGDYRDSLAIIIIVVLNAILGTVQEYRAEKALAALRRLAAPSVRVRRDGVVEEISAQKLVPGDVILLEVGNVVPADARILESINLRLQESALTGESQPVEKLVPALSEEHSIAERSNMVYLGTVVTYGRGLAMVTETGMQTELGKIAAMIQTVSAEQTPLQRRLNQLGYILVGVILLLVTIIFALGLWRGENLHLMFMIGVSLAVAAIPEALPAVVTITLALGAQRMLKRRALIRKLPAVETLGSVTVICSDKTGTLTENRMTMTMAYLVGELIDLSQHNRSTQHSSLAVLLGAATLCNDAVLKSENGTTSQQAIGDPTETALALAAAQLGLEKAQLEKVLPRVDELPFESERKRMTTLHQVTSTNDLPDALATICTGSDMATPQYLIFTKGAVDSLLELSNQVWVKGRCEPLTAHWRKQIIAAHDRMTGSGMRVLAIAFRPLTDFTGHIEEFEQELIFIGLTGLMDPARPEVKEAVSTCQSAGIRPLIITGDHPLTAQYIAQSLSIGNGGHILTGSQLDRMSVEELTNIVEEISVYARVSPAHKLKIVEALQNRGQIVAMTGDGVNDAPALKKADIGLAMGITGTDVAKEASDMVLLDDNFATIVSAVEEGRVIYDNIRKYINNTMTGNAGAIWTMFLAPFLGMPLPLLPLQVLWMNLVTDGLPSVALGLEPAERDTMKREPYHPGETIFSRGMGYHIIVMGLFIGLLLLGLGYWYWCAGAAYWQTMVLTTLIYARMAHILATRSERDSLFTVGIFSNRPLFAAVALTGVLQLCVIYLPPLQALFQTVALPTIDLLFSLALSILVFIMVEVKKWLRRRGSTQNNKQICYSERTLPT
ncbi:MAG: cation-translocating P-type ATPase [Acidobacteriota bacterium]